MKNVQFLFLFLAISCGYIDTRNETKGAFTDIIPGGSAAAPSGFFSLFSKQSLIDKSDVSEQHIQNWKTYFLGKSKERFARYLANGFQYRSIIHEIFESYGLPKELFYVGLIESGYYTRAKSHAGAHGPWQFMPRTGRSYGLKVDRYTDERRSIFKATHAAAKYLKDLYNIFNSWPLSLAAYNAGENKIIRIIRKANTRSFAELARRKLLPKETIQYIPKLVAAIELGENWENIYNVKLKDNWHLNEFKPVKLYKTVKLKELAKAVSVPLEQFKKWNPDIVSPVVQGKLKKPLTFYLHEDKVSSSLAQQLASLERFKVVKHFNPVKMRKHKIRRGDSLYRIARRNRSSIALLMKVNNLKSGSILKIGQTIKVPVLAKKRKKKVYKVKAGDNLLKIARKFNVPVRKLKRENGLTHSRIYPRQRLRIPFES